MDYDKMERLLRTRRDMLGNIARIDREHERLMAERQTATQKMMEVEAKLAKSIELVKAGDRTAIHDVPEELPEGFSMHDVPEELPEGFPMHPPEPTDSTCVKCGNPRSGEHYRWCELADPV